MSAIAITFTNVGKRFASTAVLGEVNLTIKPGEFVSLVGPSGCGKSTLLRLIAGLTEPTTGSVRVGEYPDRPRQAFVFQEPTLLPWRNVFANVRLPLELAGRVDGTTGARIDECLQLLGLTAADGKKYPRMLSGGMKMRVSLARALVTHPNLLLLDEPFGALDDVLRQRLDEELHWLWLRQQWTGVFVTHNAAEAVFLSQRVFVMGNKPGTIIAERGIPFATPRPADLRYTPAFAGLVGEVSHLLRETKE